MSIIADRKHLSTITYGKVIMTVEKFIVTKDVSGYTTLPNSVLQNLPDLEVLGLWCYFQSKPPKWEFYKDDIRNFFNIGINKLDHILNILKKHNLVEITQDRSKKGCFSTWYLHVKSGENFLPFNENHESGDHRSMKTVGTVTVGTVNSTYKRNIDKRNIKKERGGKAPQIFLPNWLPKADWEAFLIHRKRFKPDITEDDKKRIINDLHRLVKKGANVTDIINQSITNGWKGVFHIRDSHGAHNGNKRKSNSAIHYDSCKSGLKGTIFDEEPVEREINPFK